MTSYTRRITGQVEKRAYSGQYRLPKVINNANRFYMHQIIKLWVYPSLHLFLLSYLYNEAKRRLRGTVCLSVVNTTVHNSINRDGVFAPREDDAPTPEFKQW